MLVLVRHQWVALSQEVLFGCHCVIVQAARLAGLEKQYNKDLKDKLDDAARWDSI